MGGLKSDGAWLLVCLPLLLIMAMSLNALCSSMALQQRMLSADQHYIEKQTIIAHAFLAWQKRVYRQWPLLSTWEGACPIAGSLDGSLICGAEMITATACLVYLDSPYGRQQRLLHFALQQ